GVVAHHEAVALAVGLERHLAVAHDGFVTRQLQQQGQALGLLLQVLAWRGNRVERSEAQRDADDDHHDQQLHQGEAGARQAARWGARGPHWRPYSQEPTSASSPVPPGWPSAPSEKMSTSPWMPGDRYW